MAASRDGSFADRSARQLWHAGNDPRRDICIDTNLPEHEPRPARPRETDPLFAWKDYDLTVGMPHMVPGRLSEVELLKWLGAWQWESIAGMVGCPAAQIANDEGQRLYASFVDIELDLRARKGLAAFTEGSAVHLRNGTRLFARHFIEGLYLLDDRPLAPGLEADIGTRADLANLGVPWVSMDNCFVARVGGENDRLKVHAPAGIDDRDVPRTDERPVGLGEHARVQSTGDIAPAWDDTGFQTVDARHADPIRYAISPEADLNGAGLVYFARFVAMMDHGERVLLSRGLHHPLSHHLIQCLATVQRRTYYYANAQPWDSVDVSVTPSVRAGEMPEGSVSPRHRVPLEMSLRIDLHRTSDNVLMASSLVRKALVVPAHRKAVLAEAERFLGRVGASGS